MYTQRHELRKDDVDVEKKIWFYVVDIESGLETIAKGTNGNKGWREYKECSLLPL